MDFKINLV